MKILLYLVVINLFFVSSVASAGESRKAIAPASQTVAASVESEPLRILTTDGREFIFNVEIADEAAEVMRGLMFRTELADDAGMLFVFDGSAERGFWMKNTLIPLDMLFIKPDGVIHHIHAEAVPEDLTTIRSNGPVSHVLEIKGGMAAKLGIKPGDRVFSRQYFQQ